MLSRVLNSERAIRVNIAIMRAFVRLRRMLESHENLARNFAALERKHDAQFKVVLPNRKLEKGGSGAGGQHAAGTGAGSLP